MPSMFKFVSTPFRSAPATFVMPLAPYHNGSIKGWGESEERVSLGQAEARRLR